MDWNKVNNEKHIEYLNNKLKPKKKGEFTMFHSRSKKWFKLTRKRYYDCPLKNLDLNYLSQKVLKGVLKLNLENRS